MFQTLANGNQKLNFWPTVIDMITSILIIFLLINFLDTLLNQHNMDLMIIEKKQEAFMKNFQKEFKGEIKKGNIQVTPYLEELKITFSDQVLFRQGESEIEIRGEYMLRRCGRVFLKTKSMGISQIQVEGHTDDEPFNDSKYPRDNWELSTARALRVVKFFQTTFPDLPQDVFSANGYEANRPIDGASQDENRRIEIKVIFEATSD